SRCLPEAQMQRKAMKLRDASAWLGAHPWVGTSFLIGVGSGILFCLPLFPIELPDAIAQIIGAGLGAGIAVGGAAWVAGTGARRHRDALAQVLRSAAANALDKFEMLRPALKAYEGSTQPLPEGLLSDLLQTAIASEMCGSSLSKLGPAFYSDAQ